MKSIWLFSALVSLFTSIFVTLPTHAVKHVKVLLTAAVQTQPEPIHALAHTSEAAPPPLTYTVKSGDTLSNISQKLWGKADDWPRLWRHNKHLIGANYNLIQVGQVLTVPSAPLGPVAPAPPLSVTVAPSPPVTHHAEHHYSAPVVVSAPDGSLQAYAQKLLDDLGMGGEYGCLNNVIERESGWNVHAANASGAYGIPQSLPADKMAAAGSDWRDDGYTQLKWMIDDYIVPVYKTPCGAWQSEIDRGWY